jgi:hypothetical protein
VLAQPVPAAPIAEPEGVVAEQHPIRVGDTIMAPAIEARTEEEPGTIRRPGSTRTAAPPPKRHWYGLPTLALDGSAYVLLATAATKEKSAPALLPMSLPTYALGGPIVHASRGNWGRAGLSLLTRLGLPVFGAVVGYGGCSYDQGNCVSSTVSVAIVGMVVASFIDVVGMSWEPAEPPEAPLLQPALSLGRDSAWVGASGAF